MTMGMMAAILAQRPAQVKERKLATLNFYCVFDIKAGHYLPPYTAMNDGTAIRQFETAVMDELHDFNRHSEDYVLWRVGMFDSEKGGIMADPNGAMIAKAYDLKNQMQMFEDSKKQGDGA